MKKSKADLEQSVRELRARADTDNKALNDLCAVYWRLGRHDEAGAAFLALLNRLGHTQHKDFDAVYLEALAATRSCPVPVGRRFRLIRLVELIQSTAHIDGLVVECGCFRGLSSYMLCSYLRRQNPTFDGSGYHIFDSFEGLSEPTADDDIPDDWLNAEGLRQMTRAGHFAATLHEVRQGLKPFPRITYHAGWIPLTFSAMPESRYRFVHVDVDLYDPTLDAFTYFYPRLLSGGMIVSDDYSWPGARTAIDEFSKEHALELHVTEAHQAVIKKPATG